MSFYYGQRNGIQPITNSLLKLEGNGSVSITPDLAVINVGIMTENSDVKIASKENAVRSNRVLDALKGLGLSDDDIETISYNIQPLYDYSDGKTLLKGYQVTNFFEVTIKNISLIGQIYDAAIAAGANITNHLDFRLSDEEYYYQQALELAIKNAQEKALKMAKQLGVTLNIVPVKITEEIRTAVPFEKVSLSLQSPVNTPIQKRVVEVKAKITAIFHYS
jgi:uncharacterized protein